jgi:AcrR family transcriptional regulator
MARFSRKEILQGFRTRSILEATRKIIAARGFDAVTMDRVAHEAGITKGGIYLYFSNKNQLILAAIEEIAALMVQEIEGRVVPDGLPWARLCQIVQAQMEIMERHRDLLRILLLDRRLLSNGMEDKERKRLLGYRELHESRIRAILDSGVKERIFQVPDLARAAFYINQLTISTMERRMLGLSSLSLDREIHGLMEFLSGLLCHKKPVAHKAGLGDIKMPWIQEEN